MNELIYIVNARMPTEKAHGIQIAKMCEAFAKRRLRVTLVLPWRLNRSGRDLFKYYQISRSFRVKKLPSLDLVTLRIPRLGFWIQSFTFALSVFAYLLFVKRKNLVYTRDLFLTPLLAVLHSNFVCEVHHLPRHFFLYRRALARAQAVLVISRRLKTDLVKHGLDKRRILLVRDGVDLTDSRIGLSKKKCRIKLGLPLDKKLALYTGHLYRWKGVYVLAETAELLKDECLVVFVGGTPSDLKKIRRQYRGLILAGHRLPAEIPYWLKAADVLILPNSGQQSISRLYTSPMKMFEYMASRRPIVASALPSLKEVLNERNCILVKPDSPSSLMGGIRKALGDSVLAEKTAKQAADDVRRFTWTQRTKKILKFINA